MLDEEGLQTVFARHARFGEAGARAVRRVGTRASLLDRDAYSQSVTAVMMPEGHDADRFRQSCSMRSTCRSAPASGN